MGFLSIVVKYFDAAKSPSIISLKIPLRSSLLMSTASLISLKTPGPASYKKFSAATESLWEKVLSSSSTPGIYSWKDLLLPGSLFPFATVEAKLNTAWFKIVSLTKGLTASTTKALVALATRFSYSSSVILPLAKAEAAAWNGAIIVVLGSVYVRL